MREAEAGGGERGDNFPLLTAFIDSWAAQGAEKQGNRKEVGDASLLVMNGSG